MKTRPEARPDPLAAVVRLLMFCLACMVSPAHAGCWHEPRLVSMAVQIASAGFPRAAANLPRVVACDGSDFPPGVGGTYTAGEHVIRIPDWQLRQPMLDGVMAHELAHAEVALAGGDGIGNGGHSADFMHALLAAGWSQEAHRVAQSVPGAGAALEQALAWRGGPDSRGQVQPMRPSEPPVQQCVDNPVRILLVQTPQGPQWVVERVRQCRWTGARPWNRAP